MRPALLLLPLMALISASAAADTLEEKPEHHEIGGVGKFPKPKNGKGPVVTGPISGGKRDVTGSNDVHLEEVSEFAMAHLESENSDLHFVQTHADMQVVAGLMYTLQYSGNDDEGACKEAHTMVVYDKPWAKERILKSDTKKRCP